MRAARKLPQSEIGWLVFRSEQVEEARKVIRALQGEATVDSMGFGVLLERISDIFFPGTSTLHTWLRYKIFIPAIIYSVRHGRSKGATAENIRLFEHQLQKALIVAAEKRNEGRVFGIIGKNKQLDLKYWPSMIYWNGLNTLQTFGDKYLDRFKLFDLLDEEKKPRIKNDDDDYEGDSTLELFEDPTLLAISKQHIFANFEKGIFKSDLDFSLTRLEAEWFTEKYLAFHPRSLTAKLIGNTSKSLERTDSIFSLKGIGDSELESLLQLAKQYSTLAQGCTYVYNAILCRAKGKGFKEGEDRNIANLKIWLGEKASLKDWNLRSLLESISALDPKTPYSVDERFSRFVERCLGEIMRSRSATGLIETLSDEIPKRERELKGNRSRFINPKIIVPRNVYSESEYRPYLFDFRWSEGKSNLIDIIKGMGR